MARPTQEPWLSGTATGSRSGRRLVAWQVGQFALAGIVALLIVVLATAIASRRVGEREAIADARITTVIRAQGLVTPTLTDDLTAGDEAAIERVDEVVRRVVLDDSLVRVKLWTADGRIVYSDVPELIGTTWDLGADELESMATGRIEAGVSDLSKPENVYERGSGKLLEVVAQGLANKLIARRLGITDRTVKAHLTRIFNQLDVTDRTQAALWAQANLPPTV